MSYAGCVTLFKTRQSHAVRFSVHAYGHEVTGLYADCKELNFFADDKRVASVAAMSKGFCKLFNTLQEEPFLNLRNFPLKDGQPVEGEPTVYASVQEAIENIPPPRFGVVRSFNYEATAA
jgi:hypothetical protein